MCGDYFIDMTDEEKLEYNQAVYMRGFHILDAVEVHGRLLREGLERMTWKKICHPYQNQRRTMDYWTHFFHEQLFIDPVTCARPIERGSRAKVHPDGPQKIALELNPKLAIDDEDGKKYMTKFSHESDIYALGWLIREMCGDFFTDMTNEEKHEYNQAVYMRGLHIPDAAEVQGRLLREGLERMTWKKICHPYQNQRRTMDYWAHFFHEQLFIDLITCARPIERGPRAKVHPDGP
ncbi:hypothetical protein R1sor_021228 [Riccia sorocarpa]|uniref:Uncharacterized protein n=1 Tax=Riccia sorocarpa TaxID=122646 RepID=A0ABD3GGG1_9MARC